MTICECKYPDWDESDKHYLRCKNCGYEEYLE